MNDFDRFELGPLAHWWPGVGSPECGCDTYTDVLTAPDGQVIISRCHDCGAVFYAVEDAELVAS